MKRTLIACMMLTGSTLFAVSDDSNESWQRLLALVRAPLPDQRNPDDEKKRLAALEAEADAFWQRYPDHEHVWDVKLLLLRTRLERADLENQKPDLRVLEAEVKEITGAKTAAPSVQTEAGMLLMAVGEQLDAKRAETIVREFVDHPNPYIAGEARRRLAAIELTKKPLDLKFTTVDGHEFDLAKWRGKVVLVDFWATWCGPCRMEIPNLVAAYKKLHGKGFEVVGISLDSSKDKLLAYTKEKEMTWPQYFDGRVWENKISKNYGISGIPAAWLVDKKGYVRLTNVRGDLEGRVTELLNE